MYYIKTTTIPNYLCDSQDKLTMWALARLFQEAADDHTDQTKVGYEYLRNQHKAWVLCRVYYQVNSMPRMGERIVVKTWSRGECGVFAVRDYQLFLEDNPNEILAAGSSYWTIIDLEQRHVVRMHDMLDLYDHHPEPATDREVLNKLRAPSFDKVQDEVLSISVRASMLDHTQHVNNSEYIKWIFDCQIDPCNLPSAHCPFHFEINYNAETRFAETALVLRRQDNGSTWFQISNSRGVAIIARIY